MNQPNKLSRPLIEITLSRTALGLCCVAAAIGLVVLMSVIGASASPMVDGHPVILTRDRLAIKRYLDAADEWIQRMDAVAARLETLMPTPALTSTEAVTSPAASSAISITRIPTGSVPSQIALPPETPLPVLSQPASQPSNLYDRAQHAEHVLQDLQSLDREWQRIDTPAALSGLQALVNDTLQAFTQWSTQVLEAIGAPSLESLAAIPSARQAALTSLDILRRALAAQQGAVR